MNAWALVWRVAVAMGTVSWSALALETVGFERYQVIVERSPFGTPAAAGAEAAAPAPNWAEAFTFVGLVPDPVSTNVLAIIQDRERSYLRRVGEMVGDAKVKAIVTAGRASHRAEHRSGQGNLGRHRACRQCGRAAARGAGLQFPSARSLVAGARGADRLG